MRPPDPIVAILTLQNGAPLTDADLAIVGAALLPARGGTALSAAQAGFLNRMTVFLNSERRFNEADPAIAHQARTIVRDCETALWRAYFDSPFRPETQAERIIADSLFGPDRLSGRATTGGEQDEWKLRLRGALKDLRSRWLLTDDRDVHTVAHLHFAQTALEYLLAAGDQGFGMAKVHLQESLPTLPWNTLPEDVAATYYSWRVPAERHGTYHPPQGEGVVEVPTRVPRTLIGALLEIGAG